MTYFLLSCDECSLDQEQPARDLEIYPDPTIEERWRLLWSCLICGEVNRQPIARGPGRWLLRDAGVPILSPEEVLSRMLSDHTGVSRWLEAV